MFVYYETGFYDSPDFVHICTSKSAFKWRAVCMASLPRRATKRILAGELSLMCPFDLLLQQVLLTDKVWSEKYDFR